MFSLFLIEMKRLVANCIQILLQPDPINAFRALSQREKCIVLKSVSYVHACDRN